MTTKQSAEVACRLGEVETLVGYHLRRAAAVVAVDFTRTLAGTGMRQALFAILSIVAVNPGIHQGVVARLLGIQSANMVPLVNEIVEKGWIARSPAVEDRRALALTLTEAGAELFADVTRRLHAHEEALLSDLDAAERRQLVALLARIIGKEAS